MEELIPVVNEKDEIIRLEPISKVHQLGLIHRESYVYLINNKKEVLLQRRDNGLWDHSAAGHFSEKESYIDGAKREFEEELGIKIDGLKEIGYERRDTIKPESKNLRFIRIFLVKKDIPLKDFKIDSNELKEVRFFNKKELIELLKQPNLLTGSAKAFIEKYILDRI